MTKNYLDKDGRIPTYRVEEEYELLKTLDDNKPSKRIIKTKKGLKAIKAVYELEQNHNVSWYQYVKERNSGNLDDLALFYRGTKISFRQMFEKADALAKSMHATGLVAGDEIGVCVSNSPELVYILLAANRLGIKVNLFDASFDKEYLSTIIDGVSPKAMFISDDNYSGLKEILKTKKIDDIVLTSLSSSLPEDPTKCDEYEPELDEYYHYENKVPSILKEINNGESLNDFVAKGKKCIEEVPLCGDLETDFLVTYTSGSTNIGRPKQIIHKNRSLNVMGRFHDPELSGNPKIPGLRGLAHIHPNSNTDIITCISDNLLQGWSVALEPEYAEEKALDYIFLNKPNYLDISTSFLLEAAKQYLIDKRFHKDGKGRKMPFLLAVFTAGEGTQKGEEKFLNRFLREVRAGSGVSIRGLKLPFTTVSIGGGDCEHGGIYYTLWKALFQKLYSPILMGKEIGLLPVPYVVVTALKKDEKGNYVECNYDENGIIVANSYSNLSGYKNNEEATNALIIEDNLGRKWVTCKVNGYIDRTGAVHVRGRQQEKDKNSIYLFEIDETVSEDTKNILSCTTIAEGDNYISTIQFQPFKKESDQKAIQSLYNRIINKLGINVANSMYVRILPVRESYPLTAAGKRSFRLLELMEYTNTKKLSELVITKEETKKLIKKQQ